ncbi:hypothetical protein PFISCL1PPCAC_13114, partial [Pristionchus fissidentatus]
VMRNLTVNPFWFSFMPAYQHTIGVTTHAISALAIFLMVTKTPKPSRPLARYLLLMQLGILSIDLNFGFLFAPIPFFPAIAGMCNGVLCTQFGFSSHVGLVLMFFTVAYMSVCALYCFHFKCVTVRAMVNGQPVSAINSSIFRIVIFIIYTIPCISLIPVYSSIESGPAYVY